MPAVLIVAYAIGLAVALYLGIAFAIGCTLHLVGRALCLLLGMPHHGIHGHEPPEPAHETTEPAM